jgi:hypothetical protein
VEKNPAMISGIEIGIVASMLERMKPVIKAKGGHIQC